MQRRRRLPCHMGLLDRCQAAYQLWSEGVAPVYIMLQLNDQFTYGISKTTLYRWLRAFESGDINAQDLLISKNTGDTETSLPPYEWS